MKERWDLVLTAQGVKNFPYHKRRKEKQSVLTGRNLID
jgi:hypothetical protein